jgi:FkbM family methyltransferase
MLNILRWIYSTTRVVSRHVPFLRSIPTSKKRKFIRNTFIPLTYKLRNRLAGGNNDLTIPLDGDLLHLPRLLLATYGLQDYEPDTVRVMRENIRQGMTVVDAGANIGYFTMIASRLVGERGKVYAIEPGPDNLRFLRRNVEVNALRNVQVLPNAVGSQNRLRTFYLREVGTTHSFSPSVNGASVQAIDVNEISLDTAIEEPIDFIKLDIEGEEIEAIKGMQQLFERSPNLQLLVEWAPDRLRKVGFDPAELPKMLWDAGFTLSILSARGSKASPHSVGEMIRQLHQKSDISLESVNLHAKRAIR